MDYRLDKVIQYFREEGMSVGAAGFTADAPAEGPRAGFDPTLGRIDRRKKKNKNYPKELTKFYNRLLKYKGDVYKATKNGSSS